jgi:hypothetical protein
VGGNHLTTLFISLLTCHPRRDYQLRKAGGQGNRLSVVDMEALTSEVQKEAFVLLTGLDKNGDKLVDVSGFSYLAAQPLPATGCPPPPLTH